MVYGPPPARSANKLVDCMAPVTVVRLPLERKYAIIESEGITELIGIEAGDEAEVLVGALETVEVAVVAGAVVGLDEELQAGTRNASNIMSKIAHPVDKTAFLFILYLPEISSETPENISHIK